MDRNKVIKAIRKGLDESLDNENIFRIADLFESELNVAKERKMKMNEEQGKKFDKLTEPVIKFMNELHPHHTIIITHSYAELLEGEYVHNVKEKYWKD